MKRLGQSAVEFLMTYGWAMLIMLVIGIIAYQLGFFSIGSSVQPGVAGFWGVTPTDFKFSAGEEKLYLSVTNNVGAKVTLNPSSSFAKTGSLTPQMVVIGGGGYDIDSGGTRTVTFDFTGAAGAAGDRFDVLAKIDYTDERTGSATYSSSGRLWGAYEQ